MMNGCAAKAIFKLQVQAVVEQIDFKLKLQTADGKAHISRGFVVIEYDDPFFGFGPGLTIALVNVIKVTLTE